MIIFWSVKLIIFPKIRLAFFPLRDFTLLPKIWSENNRNLHNNKPPSENLWKKVRRSEHWPNPSFIENSLKSENFVAEASQSSWKSRIDQSYDMEAGGW